MTLSARPHRPSPRHPQVGAHDHAALEAQHEVLADGVDGLEDAAVDPLGDPLRLRAWVRRVGLDALSDERLQAACRAVERIALGHVSNGNSSGRSGVSRAPAAAASLRAS
jgi:hypothetical protein